jgi:hypothetical protein
MRLLLTLLTALTAFAETLSAQTAPPNGMLYQAIARDASGNLAVRRTIYVRTSIIKTSATGTVMYSDEHKVTSNADAMFTVVVGQGSFLTGSYRKISDIPWGDDKYFFNLKISVAPSLPGSSWKPTYVDMGTSQFWSVPYAMFSGAANNSRDSLTLRINGTRRELKLGSYRPVFFSVADNDSVATNEIQTLSRNGGRLMLSLNGGMVFLPDSSATNEIQTITRSGGRINLSLGGGSITLPDSSSTNELQSLTRNGGRIALSQGGGTVTLPDSSSTNELQAISKSGNTVTLNQGGGSFTDDDNQNLSLSGAGSSKRIAISNGNSITLNISDADSSTSNELQNLSRSGGRVILSQGGGTVALPDSSAANEIQNLSQTGGRISLSQGGGTVFLRDSSSTNELQNLSQSGNTITLSQGGGSVSVTDNDQQQLTISAGRGSISLSNGGRVQLADSSATNELQNLSVSGAGSSKRIAISNGNSITLNISDADSSTNNELQTISRSGGRISLNQGGGSITLPDSSASNEIQTLSQSGNTISLSNGGGSVTVTDNDKQTLSISGSGSSKTLSISGGNSVNINVSDADSSRTNEIQALSQTGGRISLSQGGGTVFLRDSSSTNELQTISKSGSTVSLSQGGGSFTDDDKQTLGVSGSGTSKTISISGGNSVVINTADADSSASNELQNLSISGAGSTKRIAISNGNSITLNISDADSSVSNELQTISRNGGRISLNQGGGTITLPDSSASNEIQTLSQSGNTISLSNGGGSVTVTDNDKQTLSAAGSGSSKTLSISGGNSVNVNVSDADSSVTNEIQFLSISANKITLSRGGGIIDLSNAIPKQLGNTYNPIRSIDTAGNYTTIKSISVPVFLNHFGDGSDGKKTVANNEVLNNLSSFSNLVIPTGVTARIPASKTTVLYVRDTLFINGIIDGSGSDASSFNMNSTNNHIGATGTGAFGDDMHGSSVLSGNGGKGFKLEWPVESQPITYPYWGGLIDIQAGTQTKFGGGRLCGDPTDGHGLNTTDLEKVIHFGSDVSGGNGWGMECCSSSGKVGGGEGGAGLYLIAQNIVFNGIIKLSGGNGGYLTCPCGSPSAYRIYSAAAGGGSCVLRTDNLISGSGKFDGSGGRQVNPWGCPNRIGGSGSMIVIKP